MNKIVTIGSVGDLLAHAKSIETEAYERYLELAEQMEMHNNPETAELFTKMARVESLHVEKILERIGNTNLPHISPWDYQWNQEEAPEVIPNHRIHYMMTPHHALTLALRGEQKAYYFFERVVENSEPGEIKDLASELLEEEREHIELMEKWLKKYPEPEDDWDEDPDPPIHQE